MSEALSILWSERQLFLDGVLNTVFLCLFAGSVAILLGAALAIVMQTTGRAISAPTRLFVDLLRSVPFLLLAYLCYYALPNLGLRLPAWWAGALSLAAYNVAYLAEIFRNAWANLPTSLLETGRAFGMTRPTLWWRIVAPQVALTSAPVVGNQMIIMIKDSAFLMIITVEEITFAANFINSNYFMPFAPFMLALLLYWALCLVVEAGVRQVSMAADRRRHA
jgi:polar amino acid transport system permease protein